MEPSERPVPYLPDDLVARVLVALDGDAATLRAAAGASRMMRRLAREARAVVPARDVTECVSEARGDVTLVSGAVAVRLVRAPRAPAGARAAPRAAEYRDALRRLVSANRPIPEFWQADGARVTCAEITRLAACDVSALRALRVEPARFSPGRAGLASERLLAGVLQAAPGLTSLDLRLDRVSHETCAALAGLTGLVSLSVKLPLLDNALVLPPSLTKLDVSFCTLPDLTSTLAPLTRLTDLDVSSTGADAEVLMTLSTVSGLRVLNLSWSSRQELEPAVEPADLDAPEELDVSHSRLEVYPLRILGLMPSRVARITRLACGCNMLADSDVRTGLEPLVQAPSISLRSLDLSVNVLGDACAPTIARLTSLRELDLSWNSLTDAGARALAEGGLDALERLDVHFNDIADAGARALAGMAALTWLDLSRNLVRDPNEARASARREGGPAINLDMQR